MQNLQLADSGKRLIAFIIDAIILSTATFIIFSILSAIGIFGVASAMPDVDDDMSGAAGAGIIAAFAGFGLFAQALSFALQIGYFTLMEASDRQATIGKSAMGLIVADENGNRLDTQKALARNISRILSGMICLIGYFMAFFTANKQALHDIIAKTNVYTKPV